MALCASYKPLPKLLQLVDDGKIALSPAVALSYLAEKEQADLLETIESEDATKRFSMSRRNTGRDCFHSRPRNPEPHIRMHHAGGHPNESVRADSACQGLCATETRIEYHRI